jgi:TonB-dependent SusC/RagA subfamily outer membrane receptor
LFIYNPLPFICEDWVQFVHSGNTICSCTQFNHRMNILSTSIKCKTYIFAAVLTHKFKNMKSYVKKIPKRTILFSMVMVSALWGGSPLEVHAADIHTMSSVQVATKQVIGKVVDSTGESVIGASVVVKGTTNGVITDIDGNFILKDVPEDGIIVISYVGYQTQEIKVTDKNIINVTLTEDTEMLEEVVVVGYGSMRKKDLTGSVVQINPTKIADSNPSNVQDLLRGTAGLQVGYDASAKGGGTMQLRGQNSVYTDGNHNTPLIVLDGMVFYGELSEINPDDIGQIDVLKEASSAAIYGAKAASGVIIITTKKGKQGKPTINVSANFGLDTKSNFRKVYNAAGYLKYREDYYKTATLGFDANGNYTYYAKGNLGIGYYDNPNNLSQYGITTDQWAAYTTNTDGESLESIYAKRMNMYNYSKDAYEGFLTGRVTDWEDVVFRTGMR